jgi:hypothetical protein
MRVSMLLGVPVAALFNLALLALLGLAPFLSAQDFDVKVGAYLVFPALVALLSWHLWALLRYREALFTTIRVFGSGIMIQNTRYGVLALNWADVRATYSRVGKMVVLESPKLIRPLAIMSFGGLYGQPDPYFLASKAMVQCLVGERWTERWFLP